MGNDVTNFECSIVGEVKKSKVGKRELGKRNKSK